MNYKLFIISILIHYASNLFGQDKKRIPTETPTESNNADTTKTLVSRIEKFNRRAEKFFTYVPVTIISYSQETGNNFGIAKYNMIHFYKDDSITSPSKFTALTTFSTLGNIKLIGDWKVYFKENKQLIYGTIGYRYFPEYIIGTGNRPSRDSLEKITNEVFWVELYFAKQFIQDNFLGLGFNYQNFLSVNKEHDSFLSRNDILGSNGGKISGLMLFYIFDNRKNRYTPFNGGYIELTLKSNNKAFGSDYTYLDVRLDTRKYFKVFNTNVIAVQGFCGIQNGNIPYFDLYKLGGDNQMRGYYFGAIRDQNIFMTQIEYRLPIWNIFGMTAWYGKGKVYSKNEKLTLYEMWNSYGLGLRIMVDSKSKTNLRLDLGFNDYGNPAFILNFSEAF